MRDLGFHTPTVQARVLQVLAEREPKTNKQLAAILEYSIDTVRIATTVLRASGYIQKLARVRSGKYGTWALYGATPAGVEWIAGQRAGGQLGPLPDFEDAARKAKLADARTRRELLTQVLKIFLDGPRMNADINAALGGKYLNVSGITKSLLVLGYIRELDRVKAKRGAPSIRFEITALGRRHLDEPVVSAGMSDEQYDKKRTQLANLKDELARETYRRFLLKKPEYSDLPFEQLTPVDSVLCESDDCPYPNCHGYPGGPAGFRRCVFCEDGVSASG